MTIIVSCFISLFSLYFSLKTRFPTPETNKYLPFLPTRFSVSSKYDTPIKTVDYSSDSISSAFSGFLEMYFRFQGLHHKYFVDNEYVPFSPSAVSKIIEKYCKGSDSISCRGYDEQMFPFGFNSMNMYQFFLDFPSAMNEFAIESVCTNGHDCNLNNSMIHFVMRSPSYSRNVYDIKKMLYDFKRPLLFTMPHMYSDFYLPCSDSRVNSTKECLNSELKCPQSIKHSFCGIYRVDTLLNSGQFVVPVSPAKPYVGEMINFVLVGYSDDFIPGGSVHRFKSHRYSRGGFIARGYQGNPKAHSIEFFEGKTELYMELNRCFSEKDPGVWRSCRYNVSTPNECFTQNRLKCINSNYCNPSYDYAFVKSYTTTGEALVFEEESGLTLTKLYQVDKNSNTVRGKFDYNVLPFWQLDMAFESHIFDGFETNNDLCSYVYIPYELVEMALSMESPGMGGVVAMDLPIRFTKSSYLNGESLRSEIKNSIKKIVDTR